MKEGDVCLDPQLELPPRCPNHRTITDGNPPRPLSYLGWHQWAEEQDEKGIHQTQCPICKRWLFPEELGNA